MGELAKLDTHHVDDWVSWLRDVRRVRGATLDGYQRTLHQFAGWDGGDDSDAATDWRTVDAPYIERFMGRPRPRCGVAAPATQDRDRIAISGFYKWMIARGRAVDNPVFDVGVPRVNNRAPRAIADPVWRQVWLSEVCDDDRVWLGLGCFAGLRRQEIVSIAPSQVDPARGLLLQLSRKGGTEDAVEFEQMTRILADGLPALLPEPDRWLDLIAERSVSRRGERCLITYDTPATEATRQRSSFTDPLLPDPAVINKRLIAVLKGAGLAPHLFTPHALRHTCVTNLLRCGVPIEVVSDAVGHTNIDTTRRYVKASGRLADWRSRLAA